MRPVINQKPRKTTTRRRVKPTTRLRFYFLSGEFFGRYGRLFLYGTSIVLFLGVPLGLWMGNVPQQIWQWGIAKSLSVTGALGFSVKEIYVEGRYAANAQAILNAVGLKRGDPILQTSPNEIRERLQQNPWVRQAVVRRQLPGILYIQLEERQPIAVWQHQQKFYLIDDQSVVIAPLTPEKQQTILPVVVGKDAPLHAPQMLKILDSFPIIKQRLSSLVYVSGRRWNLFLDQTIEVRLPEKNIEIALARLSVLLDQKKLDSQEVYQVDLRLPDRMAIRLSPTASARLKIKGKET